MESILDSTKRTLGLEEDDTSFDVDIILFINSVFSTLNQLGVGPDEGFAIEDKTVTWSSYLGDDLKLNSVKTYMYLKVRLLFDPPGTSFAIDALNKQALEFEWRINTQRELDTYVPPVAIDEDDEGYISGGVP